MKKIITLFSLMLCMFATAQEAVDTMYIYRNDNVIERIPVSKIDSVVFVAPVTPQYEAVDLGLPSGVKWASFNVGATKPEEYGGYYAWGETEEKEDYSWSTYKWCNGSYYTLTKYCTDSYGTVDNKTVLDPEDDVAHVKWGGDWRMPTKEEQDELRNSCSWEWTSVNGVNGYNVTGPNGNSIFLPGAGNRGGTDVNYRGYLGNYWSGSLLSYRSSGASFLYFYDEDYSWNGNDRSFGLSVRPVCDAPVVNYTVSVLNNENGTVLINGANVASALVADGTEVTVIATANDGYEFVGWFIGDNDTAVSTDATYTFIVAEDIELVAKFEKVANTPTFINGYEYVDLGLSVKWAAHNVGATKPEEYGGYYAWGETEEKESYYEEDYLYYNYASYTNIGSNISGTQYDVAHVKWGGDWRMPTTDEQQELINNCSWEWTTLNGINGYRVTGPNGNSIFLPAAGYRGGTGVDGRGSYGDYWSGSLSSNGSGLAYYLNFNVGYFDWYYYYRYYGRSVRPVSE